jgi:hypothetical protein
VSKFVTRGKAVARAKCGPETISCAKGASEPVNLAKDGSKPVNLVPQPVTAGQLVSPMAKVIPEHSTIYYSIVMLC